MFRPFIADITQLYQITKCIKEGMIEAVIFNNRIRSYSLQWTTEFIKKKFYIYDGGIVKEYKAETCNKKYI